MNGMFFKWVNVEMCVVHIIIIHQKLTQDIYTQSYYVLFSSIIENKVITRLHYKHYF
jgi:hypothetical protein